MSDLFPGEARPLPPRTGSTAVVVFGPDVPPPPPPVTHAAGYGPFVALVAERGGDPSSLVRDPVAFGTAVVAHADALRDPALEAAAGIFLGNALVVLHPGAVWREAAEPEVGTDARPIEVKRVIRALRDGEAAPELLGDLVAGWDDADRGQEAGERALEDAIAVSGAADLTGPPVFDRPAIEVPVVLDDRGRPIPYGDRWPFGATPEDAYSRVTHPERFAALHPLGEALVDHLRRAHDVAVRRGRDENGRAVVDLAPAAGAPLRLTFSSFPGVRVQAGLLLDRPLPSCGCDACDEDPAGLLTELEQTVLGVVRGGYVERLPDPDGRGGATWLTCPDGSGGGSSGARDVPDDALVDEEQVRALGGAAWPAWPLREPREG